MEEIIYKSGQTSVYECEHNYRIVNEDGYFAFIDKDDRILGALNRLMEGRRSLYYSPIMRCLYLNINNKFVCNLRQLVVASTMDGDFFENLENVKRGCVKMKNPQDDRNFCRDNLEYTKTSSDNTINTFWDDGEYFYIRHNPTGMVVKTDYLPPLNDLIKNKRWFYSKKFEMMVATKEKNCHKFIRLYSFIAAYSSYNGKIDYEDHYDSWLGIMAENDMCVDHIDTDRNNCTSTNLAIVKRNQNIKKGNMTLKCNQAPFICAAVVLDDKISMAAGYNDGSTQIQACSSYTDFDDFITSLKEFYNSGIIKNENGTEIKLPQIPKEYLKGKKDFSDLSDNEEILKKLLEEMV